MKKYIVALSFALFAIVSFAQDESSHMKFSGIPLDNTISHFQSKLLSKGYTANKSLNSQIPVGTRSFKGTFLGEKAEIAVYYDEETKIVYAAKAYYDGLTEERANEKFENIKHMLEIKYNDGVITEDENSSLPKISLRTILGRISLYIWKNENLYNYPYHYTLHIQYEDYINSHKYVSKKMEDL